MSTCAMIQPPKMSPFWLASAGIGMTRSAGILPSGSLSSTGLQIVQWSAAEWRKPRPEDEPGVHQVGVGDDAVGEHRFGLAQVGLDQRIHEGLVVAVRLALDRLSIDVSIDSLTRFLAEVPQRHLVGQDLGHRGRALRQRLAGGEAD